MKLTPIQLRELVDGRSSTLPEGAAERVIVDWVGGLAYPLFGSYFSSFVISVDDSRGKMDSIDRYHNAVRDYVDDAGQHARDCGFNLVYIARNTLERRGNGSTISSDFGHNNVPLYKMGVGKTPVTSARSVEQFCRMIKSGHDRFEDQYNKIRELAEKLRSLD